MYGHSKTNTLERGARLASHSPNLGPTIITDNATSIRAPVTRPSHTAKGRVFQNGLSFDKANQSLRELTARLLQLQDEERRRFARELHDSVGQVLAALIMNLSVARTDIERLTQTANVLSESEALVQEMSKEVRTISHLLHPPLPDEAGLSSALRWYVEGFAERSKIKVDLEFPDDFGRL
jgi:signal transduction histidine kinase